MAKSTFTFIGDEQIWDIISRAQRCVIYAAPNVSDKIANAFWVNAEFKETVTQRVIIDANAEALRLGFGQFGGLKELAEKGIDIRKAPGLRVGVLVVDEKAWVFSPTPEIIFDQPDESTLNAVAVSRDFAQQILGSIAPDLSIDPDEPLSNVVIPDSTEPELGAKPITKTDIEIIEKDLAEAPPQKFDLTRQIRVYQNHFQFVDIKLDGCNLGSHTIKIPKELLSLVKDANIRKRIRAAYKLLDAESKTIAEFTKITEAVNELREEFTDSMGDDLGRIIAKAAREKFDTRAEAIKSELERLRGQVFESLMGDVEKNCKALAEQLVPAVVADPPSQLKKELFHGNVDEETARDYVVRELMPTESAMGKLIHGMRLHWSFKDITYEMLNDSDFVEKVRAKYPKLARIHDETDAIGESRLPFREV